MIFQKIIMFFAGCVNISVEGFFIEKFINICKSKNIILQNLHKKNDTYLIATVLKDDFKEIVNISKRTKCKLKINKKIGLPFFINKYRKRKIFVIAFCTIILLLLVSTKFIWNIDISGNENIATEEILEIVNRYGINTGVLKSNINTEKISNLILMERNDIAWIGINIKGTNASISIKESIKIPEIIDKNEVCNIVAIKSSTISKIVVQSGTARVKEGDKVEKGDLLVEGVMDGANTGIRYVHAEADIYGENSYTKEKKENFVQNDTVKSGKQEKKYEICINNFKINFNKGVSKFKNYDTISSNKKVKFFSNYYFPIEVNIITNNELNMVEKKYSESELKIKIIKELEDEFEKDYKISEYDKENIIRNEEILKNYDGLSIKLIYTIREKIGTKVNVNQGRE